MHNIGVGQPAATLLAIGAIKTLVRKGILRKTDTVAIYAKENRASPVIYGLYRHPAVQEMIEQAGLPKDPLDLPRKCYVGFAYIEKTVRVERDTQIYQHMSELESAFMPVAPGDCIWKFTRQVFLPEPLAPGRGNGPFHFAGINWREGDYPETHRDVYENHGLYQNSNRIPRAGDCVYIGYGPERGKLATVEKIQEDGIARLGLGAPYYCRQLFLIHPGKDSP